MSDKAVPANVEAERATLGSLLMDRDAVIAVASWLSPADFYLEQHRRIYEAVLACYARRVPPDLQTVAEELRKREQLAAVGDLSGLVELTNSVPTAMHVEYYAEPVTQTATLRRLIQAGGQIAALGFEEDREPEDVYAEAMRTLLSTAPRVNQDTIVPIERAVSRLYDRMQHGVPSGRRTGLYALDGILGGFHDGQLIVVGARPGVGKSALAVQLAYNMARAGGAVLFYSLEMSADENAMRFTALIADIDSRLIREYDNRRRGPGTLSDEDLVKVTDALGDLAGLPITIDATSGLSLTDLRTRSLQFKAHNGAIALLIVDYLQLVRERSRRNGSRFDEVSEVARGLKDIAGELHCPVLALAQLNRQLEGRADKVPVLSDLRETGEIEQAADIVIFPYREEMYKASTERKGVVDLHISKHRQGAVGMASVQYHPPTGRWRDMGRTY